MSRLDDQLLQLTETANAGMDIEGGWFAELAERLEVTRLVTQHWLDGTLEADYSEGKAIAHVCGIVLKALDGTTNPRSLGIVPDSPEWRYLERLSLKQERDEDR